VHASALSKYAHRDDVVVLGRLRGVAYEVAMELRAPLDVFVVRKLGYQAIQYLRQALSRRRHYGAHP
jgi:predicted phosphoribosyltransferase